MSDLLGLFDKVNEMLHKRRVAEVWRPEFEKLAQYNAERSRGLVHTPVWQERMAELQRQLDEAYSVAREQPD